MSHENPLQPQLQDCNRSYPPSYQSAAYHNWRYTTTSNLVQLRSMASVQLVIVSEWVPIFSRKVLRGHALSGPFAEYKELHNLTDVFMINAVSRIHASESSFPSEHALLNDVLWLEALFPRDREISKLITLLRRKYSTAEDVAAVFGQFAVREELSKVGFARLLG